MFALFAGFVSYEKPTYRFSGEVPELKNVPCRCSELNGELDPVIDCFASSSSSALYGVVVKMKSDSVFQKLRGGAV